MPSSDAGPRYGGHRVVGALEKRGGVLTRRAVMPVRFVPMTGEAGQVPERGAGCLITEGVSSVVPFIGPVGKRGRSLRGLRHRQRDALQRCGSSAWRAPRCRCPRLRFNPPHPPGGDARAGGYRPGGKARTFIARPEASTTRCPPAMRVLGMEGTALSVPKAALQSPGGIRERGCRTVEGLTPPANASSAECKGGVRAGRNRDLFRYAR